MTWSTHIENVISKAHWIFFLIRRTFSTNIPISVKKQLYSSLVLPILTYCSPVWRPHLLKDITALERFHRRATKFIVNNPSLDYKTRLSNLHMLPILYILEIADIMFAIASFKNPSNHFDFHQLISFCEGNTRSCSSLKLKHRFSNNNKSRHSYFNRIPRLWNSFPHIDPNKCSLQIKNEIISHMTDHFYTHFDHNIPCTYHYLCPCSCCNP